MKKTILRLTAALLLLVFSFGACLAEQSAEEQEIRFLDIPWESSMEEVGSLLEASGLINQAGVERIDSSIKRKSRSIGMILEERDGEIGYGRARGKNQAGFRLMSDMFAQEYLGCEIHNIGFTFAYDGENTKLLSVEVSTMPGADEEQLEKDLKALYGNGKQGEDDSRFWKGANNTGLLLWGFGELYYGRLDAQEILDATVYRMPESEATATPVPVPTDVIGAGDLIPSESPSGGEITFLGLPWSLDVQQTLNALVDSGMADKSDIPLRPFEIKTPGTLIRYAEGYGWNTESASADNVQAVFLWIDFHKTFGGYPVHSMTLTFLQDGDKYLLATAELVLDGVTDAEETRKELREKLAPIYGEDTGDYASAWQGAGNTCMIISGIGTFCHVTMGRVVPAE